MKGTEEEQSSIEIPSTPQGRRKRRRTMSPVLLRSLLALLLFMVIPQKSDAQVAQWCIANQQTPDDELQRAIDWACGPGKADCSKTLKNQPCNLPDTVRDHASWIFNNYYQNNKKMGATCSFNGAAMITQLDPSHGPCKFEYIP